jgi:4-amino-4-deoxy-L-arabinose transferase-like glycosyltransferase
MNSSGITKRQEIAVLGFILSAAFIVRVPFFSVPPERDEGMYATVAQVILNGGMPYRDIVMFRPPGIYYIYSLWFSLFGQSVEALRIGSALFAVLTSLVIYKFAGRLYGWGAGVLAASLYALFSSGPLIQGGLANTETFMMLPAVMATYIFYLGYRERKELFFIGAGALSGGAYLFKESTLPNFLMLFLFSIIVNENLFSLSGLKRLLLRYLFLIGGFAASVAFAFIYLELNGALSHYIAGAYNWNKSYGQFQWDMFWGRLKGRGIYSLGREYSILWIAAAVSIFMTVIRDRNRDNLYVALWIFFSFTGVCLGTMFWPHYFIQMIPSLSIASASGAIYAYNGILDRRIIVKGMSFLIFVIFFISAGYAIKTDYKFYFTYTPDEISKYIYGDDTFVKAKKIAAYVRERTLPSDYIYQNRWEAEIYFLSQRRSPTKYFTHETFYGTSDVLKAIDEFRNDLFYKEPKYIILFPAREGEVPAFVAGPIVKMKYELETRIDGVDIYRLKVKG